MKAVQFTEYGGPEVLKVVDVEEPHAAGQIRVAVRAAGVNSFDWKIRRGALAAVMPMSSLPEWAWMHRESWTRSATV